jgi:hypothetical protein
MCCHAQRQFGHEHPEVENEWFITSNYIVLLTVKNQEELITLISKARGENILLSFFVEPDIDNEVASIALEPGIKTKKLCRKLKLLS